MKLKSVRIGAAMMLMLLYGIAILLFLSGSSFFWREYSKSEKIECNNDRELVASTINAECSICTVSEKKLVGITILNRVLDKRFPDNVLDVVHQPNQFSGVNSSLFLVNDKTMKLANEVFEMDTSVILEGPLWFYNPNTATNKKFIEAMKKKERIETNNFKHNFYR